MRTLLLLLLSLTLLAVAETATIIDVSPSLPRPQNLGTMGYAPLAREAPFQAHLAPNEQTTGSMFGDYPLSGHAGQSVGWFGIVRVIEGPVLTVEMRYFDGMTDTHLQVVSSHGSGDFKAVLSGPVHDIKLLDLVKVYGKVSSTDPPSIQADYVRVWDWGQFTFMPYGHDHGNPKWRPPHVDLDGQEVYNPAPTPPYYEKLLGHR